MTATDSLRPRIKLKLARFALWFLHDTHSNTHTQQCDLNTETLWLVVVKTEWARISSRWHFRKRTPALAKRLTNVSISTGYRGKQTVTFPEQRGLYNARQGDPALLLLPLSSSLPFLAVAAFPIVRWRATRAILGRHDSESLAARQLPSGRVWWKGDGQISNGSSLPRVSATLIAESLLTFSQLLLFFFFLFSR